MKYKNYPNWLVPIEQAKKLKEIGFDEPTQNTTSSDVLESKRYKEKNKIYSQNYILKESPYDANSTEKGISIPTWEQVLEWFRKKGLYGFVLFDNTYPDAESETFSFEIRKINRKLIYSSEDNSTDEFSSYEAAREALVNKLIEYKSYGITHKTEK